MDNDIDDSVNMGLENESNSMQRITEVDENEQQETEHLMIPKTL